MKGRPAVLIAALAAAVTAGFLCGLGFAQSREPHYQASDNGSTSDLCGPVASQSSDCPECPEPRECPGPNSVSQVAEGFPEEGEDWPPQLWQEYGRDGLAAQAVLEASGVAVEDFELDCSEYPCIALFEVPAPDTGLESGMKQALGPLQGTNVRTVNASCDFRRPLVASCAVPILHPDVYAGDSIEDEKFNLRPRIRHLLGNP